MFPWAENLPVTETATCKHKPSSSGTPPRLIELANGAAPAPPDRADTAEFLDKVLSDFETFADKPGRRPSLPGEDVFWWRVTILEELAEVRPGAAAQAPYVVMMRDQLKSMGGHLAAREPLPDEFQIHWFDDEADDGDGVL